MSAITHLRTPLLAQPYQDTSATDVAAYLQGVSVPLGRQRSTSSENLIPEAKRSRFEAGSVPHGQWQHSHLLPEQPFAINNVASSGGTAAPLEGAVSPGAGWSSLPGVSLSQLPSYIDPSCLSGAGPVDRPPLYKIRTVLPTPVATPRDAFARPQLPSRSTSACMAAEGRRDLTAKALASLPSRVAYGSQQEARPNGLADLSILAEGHGVGLGVHLPVRSATDPSDLRRESALQQALVESARKERFVAGLVGASVLAIESIWGPAGASADPTSSSPPSGEVLPVQWYIKELIRRSRTHCSTLQLALYYLHKSRREIRDTVAQAYLVRAEVSSRTAELCGGTSYPSPPHSPTEAATEAAQTRARNQARFDILEEADTSPLLCGRRMFLAALIAASKYLQDRNYSNRAWAKISGLSIQEINRNERVFLNLLQFSLHIPAHEFQKWTERLSALSCQATVSLASIPLAADPLVDTQGRPALGVRSLGRSASEYPPAEPQKGPLSTKAALPSCAPGARLARSQSEAHLPNHSLPNPSLPPRSAVTPLGPNPPASAHAIVGSDPPQPRSVAVILPPSPDDSGPYSSTTESDTDEDGSDTGGSVRGVPLRSNNINLGAVSRAKAASARPLPSSSILRTTAATRS